MAKFLSIAVPGYTGPSSRTVQRKLTKLYFEKYQQFKKELSEVTNLSITVDLWKSKRRHHYLCMTSHWLDSNFNFKTKILSFRQFKGRHLAFRIRRHMERVISNFDLGNKIIATTTDDGANIKAASSQINSFGIRIHCLAYALNLVVHKALLLWPPNKSNAKEAESDLPEEFSSSIHAHNITVLMGKCRIIISTIRKYSNIYEFVQNLATDQLIKSDMQIRWNSSYKMLHRLTLYQSVLNKLYDEIEFIPGITKKQRKTLLDSKLDEYN